MKLPEIQQLAFQGSAQSTPFDPLKVPDPNIGVQAKLNSIGASIKNLQDSGKQQYAALEMSAKQAQDLYEFAPKALGTALKTGQDIRDRMAKQWAAEHAYKLDDKTLLDTVERNATANMDAVAREGSEELIPMRKEGVSYELTKQVAGAVGLRAKYLNQEHAKRLGVLFPEWIQEQLRTNDATVELEGYGKVRLNNRLDDPAVHKAKQDYLLRAAFGIDDITGNESIPLDIMTVHGMPRIREALSQQSQRYDRSWRSLTGENQRVDAKRAITEILADKRLSAAEKADKIAIQHNIIAATPPVSGDDTILGHADANKQVDGLIASLAANDPNLDVYRDYLNLPSGRLGPDGKPLINKKTGKPFTHAELDPQRAINLIARVQKEKTGAFTADLQTQQQALRKEVMAYHQDVTENPGRYSFADISAKSREFEQRGEGLFMTPAQYGLTALSQARFRYSKGAQALQQERQDLLDDLDMGRGSTTHEYFQTPLGQADTELFNRAKQQEQDHLAPWAKDLKKTLFADFGGATQTQQNVNGDLVKNHVQAMATIEYKKAREEAAVRIRNGEDETLVVNQVSAKYAAEFRKAIAPGSGHLYEGDNKGTFPRFGKSLEQGAESNTTYKQIDPALNAVKQLSSGFVGPGGPAAVSVHALFHQQPDLVMNKEMTAANYSNMLATGAAAPIFDIYAKQINKAAGTTVYKSGMDLLFALQRSYEPGISGAALEQTVNQMNQLTGENKRFAQRYANGQYANPGGVYLRTDTPVYPGRPPVASTIAAVGTQKTYTTEQRSFANRVYELAKRNGASHPEVAAAIASLETGFGKTQADNNVFNLRAVGGGFEKFATLEDAVKRFIKLWDKNHSGFRNLESFDDPNEAFAAIVNAYAPEADQNNPAAYKQFVADFIKSQGYLLQ